VDPAFRVERLEKYYGGVTALAGVDLEVDAGELFGLLGPNGAGKSTLVRIGCGLARADGGRATVCGHAAGSVEARRRIGYLAELFRFPSWLSADEVLTVHQRLARSAGGREERERLLAMVGLSDVATRRVGAMSKGMQQRLGIAQALIGAPAVLILDEPTSALDPAGRRLVRDLLAGLREQGTAVLLNSHLLSEVEMVCDRVAILSHGRVVAAGTPDSLTSARGVVVETQEGSRRFDVARGEIPDLVARLVAGGDRIFSVVPSRSTLEEFYLETVGGEIG